MPTILGICGFNANQKVSESKVVRGFQPKKEAQMFKKPNYTQVPNEFFDEMLPTLKEGELRILIVIMRQTFGWGNKEWDRISITQLMKKSGMERMAVVRATKSLVEKKLITKHKEGTKGQENSWYSLIVENETEFSNPIDDSNNSYQYPKDTPPSILKIPTKETITKEKDIREEAHAPQPSSKDLFWEHKRVKIKFEKLTKLQEEFGVPKIIEMADRLDEYADINPKRFKQYACHAAVIRKWIREDEKKQSTWKSSKPFAKQQSKASGAVFHDDSIITWKFIKQLEETDPLAAKHELNKLNETQKERYGRWRAGTLYATP